MFKTARLKLTGWYLLIILTVSIAFSVVIYRSASFELRRFAQAQQNRFERKAPPFPPLMNEELIDEANGRIKNSLIIINVSILFLSSLLGYYLSGKTLRPIQEMMDEQDRFISDASHELKTPITALRTSMEVSLRDKELVSNSARQFLVSNLADVIRLQKLTEGLLELSKPQPLMHEKCLLGQIVDDAVKEVAPISAEKHIQINVRTSPSLVVEVEPVAIKRAIVALLDNAIKYSNPGREIAVSSTCNSKVVMLKIRDRGIGIAPGELENVTKRFYRSDKARNSKGYGLGLPIAKSIIELHGGNMTIESKLNTGTTVIVALPFSARIQK